MQKYKTRNDVPEKYKWDLTAFFKDEDDFNKSLEEAKKLVENIKTYNGCTKSTESLREFLDEDSKTESLVENLYVYAYLINDQELGNSKSMERLSKAEKIMTDYGNNTSFFNPELLSLSKEEFEILSNNNLLKDYKVLLERIYRYKDHILTENEEIIVNELTSSMDHFGEMSSTMLNFEHDYGTVNIDGEDVVITSTNLRKLLKNKDFNVRKEVYEKSRKVLEQYSVSSAQFLDSYVKGASSIAKIRKHASSWEQKLFSNNMNSKVYETLVKVVEEHADSLQEYMKLFKEELGLTTLKPYDLSLDLVENTREYTIEESWELCRKALSVLGEDYIKHFNKIIDNRYIDYCEYKGKCSGGYSFSTSTQDSRILLSFNDDLDSVSTIIHEAGHNVHHQLVKENNLLQYRGVSSLVSEVASLTNECLLSSYLSENGETKNEKLSGIANILSTIENNLFDCIREAKMEEDFYKHVESGNSITNEYMNKLTRESLVKYYGSTVDFDDYSNLSWIRRSHYYMNFYLYSYAICISIATYVASKILSGDKDMLESYLKFLKTGGDKWPMEAFEILGVNLEKQDVYEDAIKYFDGMVKTYKKVSKGE